MSHLDIGHVKLGSNVEPHSTLFSLELIKHSIYIKRMVPNNVSQDFTA
jgi:hypothetical protein